MSDEELAGHVLVVSGHDGGGQLVDGVQPAGVIFVGRALLGEAGPRPPEGGSMPAAGLPDLVAELQDRADVPLLVALDQEHGPVVRLGAPFTHFPSAMALAATGDEDLVREVAAAAGRELGTAGVNVNLAPVADVNTEPTNPVIGVRSPGDDPTDVARFVTATVRGLQQDAGIAATVKHFPGHGSTVRDSHTALPRVTRSLEELRATGLVPFQAAVEAGVDLVMTGHLLVPEIAESRPATLSPELLEVVLRDELGFDGVVMSDALNMEGLPGSDDPATAVAALRAGVDLVLMPPDPRRARDAIVAALADGTLDRERLVRSVRRVLALKVDLGLLPGREVAPPQLPEPDRVARHRALAVRVGALAATVLDGPCPTPMARTAVTVTGDHRAVVADLLSSAGVTVADDAATRLVLWDGRGAAPADAQAIVAVTGSPYAAGRVASYATLVTTYGDTRATLRGLVRALAAGRFSGTSPVTIPRSTDGAFPTGAGVACTPQQ